MKASAAYRCPPSLDNFCVCGERKCEKLTYVQPALRKSFKPTYHTPTNVSMGNETIYKLSYQYPHGFQSSESFKPKALPHRYDFPMGENTIQSLSYTAPKLPVKEQYPWAIRKYVPSEVKMANVTIQKLSYMPPGEYVQVDG